jgi:pyruvate kinase
MKVLVRTKIVCTIGPATEEVEVLKELMNSGMDVARINCSHGDHDQHARIIANVRQASKDVGEHIAILIDLSGPKIRTGLVDGGTVDLKSGAELTLTVEDVVGSASLVSVNYADLPREISIGAPILLDDGKMLLKTISKTDRSITAVVQTGGILTDRKGINLPGTRLSVPSLTEKDLEDVKFALKQDVDYLALSFVRSADDVRALREVLLREGVEGRGVPIVAKIEKKEAVADIGDIISVSDAVMVARGDLGVELPTEDVPPIQKMIVRKCNDAGVPVIIATQMLESMIQNPRPTRAEASDVANAVLDGADAVMLSGETSVGAYPVQAVETMNRVIQKSEGGWVSLGEGAMLERVKKGDIFDSVARAACVLARQVGAKAIVPLTHSGATAQRVSKYRPDMPVYPVTGWEKILRRMSLFWGVQGFLVPDFEQDSDTAFRKVKEELLRLDYVQKGDYIVLTAGIPLMSKETTNALKVDRIE